MVTFSDDLLRVYFNYPPKGHLPTLALTVPAAGTVSVKLFFNECTSMGQTCLVQRSHGDRHTNTTKHPSTNYML